MPHLKRNIENRQVQRGKAFLTKSELDQIRDILPFNWRDLIHQKHDSIKLRQITQVFSQQTTNPADNLAVWTEINTCLTNAGKKKLSQKVEKLLSFYSSLCNVSQ